MAYRRPYFVFLHAGRAAGSAGITMSPAASSLFPKYKSIDGFGQSLAKHGSSSANAYWQVDRGAAGLEAVDYLLIPSGHNLGAQTVQIASSTTGAFAGEQVVLGVPVSAAGLFETAFTSSTARYIRVSFTGTGTWEYGEIWLGRKRQTTAETFDPGWGRPPRTNVTVQRFPSGVQGAVVNGGNQATWEMGLKWLTGSDLTLVEELAAACAGEKATVWVAGPDDTVPTKLMWMADTPNWKQDSPNHPAFVTYGVELSFLEALG